MWNTLYGVSLFKICQHLGRKWSIKIIPNYDFVFRQTSSALTSMILNRHKSGNRLSGLGNSYLLTALCPHDKHIKVCFCFADIYSHNFPRKELSELLNPHIINYGLKSRAKSSKITDRNLSSHSLYLSKNLSKE